MADIKIFWLSGGPSGQRLVIDVGNAEFKPAPPENPPIEVTPPVITPPEITPPVIKPIEIPPPNDTDEPEKVLPPSTLDTKNIDKKGEKQSSKKNTGEKKNKPDSDKPDKNKSDRDKSSDIKGNDDKKSDKRDKSKDDKKKPKEGIDEPSSEIDKDLKELMGLKGKTIVIDAGHGGADAGAIGPTGVTEKSVTLRVALELRELLENEGAKVIMTRTTDRQVSSKGDKASAIEELQARCTVANSAKADIFVSIHADSFTNANARGTTGYYFTGSEKSKKLADCIRKALCEQIRTPSRGTKSCNFYVVRHTTMPATLVELAFISNKEEEELLDSDEGVTRAAQGIFDGIEDYFG
ncbi:MAG: N-acetylmuramoyl-L-alanine amidase [Selenomonadaceae bacterium]|nr:N-acetylmuramoyl-L-alanine amidase [Selenomonadaceae bacterium]